MSDLRIKRLTSKNWELCQHFGGAEDWVLISLSKAGPSMPVRHRSGELSVSPFEKAEVTYFKRGGGAWSEVCVVGGLVAAL